MLQDPRACRQKDCPVAWGRFWSLQWQPRKPRRGNPYFWTRPQLHSKGASADPDAAVEFSQNPVEYRKTANPRPETKLKFAIEPLARFLSAFLAASELDRRRSETCQAAATSSLASSVGFENITSWEAAISTKAVGLEGHA